MKESYSYHRFSDELHSLGRAIAIGNFDGVHRGHQELIERTCLWARARNLEASVLTFNPHPQEFLHPGKGPMLIMSLDEKLEFLNAMGVDSVIVQTFDKEFADSSPSEFARYVHDELHAQHVIVGFNYTFGKYGAGKPDDLRAFGEKIGFDVDVVPAQTYDGAAISSSRIREALSTNDSALVEQLLGYPIHGLRE